MILYVVILSLSSWIFCSEPYMVIIPNCPDSMDSVSSEQSDEEDNLCERALNTFDVGQVQYRNLKPYLKKIMKQERGSPLSDDHKYSFVLKKMKEYEREKDFNAMLKARQFVLDAARMAIDEKEMELKQLNLDLIRKDLILSKKTSKRNAAILTGLSSIVTGVSTALIVYFSK